MCTLLRFRRVGDASTPDVKLPVVLQTRTPDTGVAAPPAPLSKRRSGSQLAGAVVEANRFRKNTSKSQNSIKSQTPPLQGAAGTPNRGWCTWVPASPKLRRPRRKAYRAWCGTRNLGKMKGPGTPATSSSSPRKPPVQGNMAQADVVLAGADAKTLQPREHQLSLGLSNVEVGSALVLRSGFCRSLKIEELHTVDARAFTGRRSHTIHTSQSSTW